MNTFIKRYISKVTAGAYIVAGLFLVTTPAFASTLIEFEDLVRRATGTINLVIILLAAVCVIVFIVGLIRFIFNDNSSKKADARNYMIWSVIAFAVLTALFAIANVLAGLVPDSASNELTLPQIRQGLNSSQTTTANNIPNVDPCYMYNINSQAYVDCVQQHS